MNADLFVIGLGPGDPELITLKGLRRLQSASVIFVPRSTERRASIALQIAAPYLDLTRQRVVELPLVMAKEAGAMREAWDAAAAIIARDIPQGGCAAYLMLGDPSLYGSFLYLAERLTAQRADVRIEIVPGIHSYSAAAALTNFPLALGDERVAILPAAYEDDLERVREMVRAFDTLILMKANRALPRWRPLLRELGLDARVVVVEKLGFPEQRIFYGLDQVQGETLHYLSLAIIRKTN